MVNLADVRRVVALMTGLLAFASLAVSWVRLRRMRHRYPDYWRELGRPRLVSLPRRASRDAPTRSAANGATAGAQQDRQLLVLGRLVSLTGYITVLLFVCYWLLALAEEWAH